MEGAQKGWVKILNLDPSEMGFAEADVPPHRWRCGISGHGGEELLSFPHFISSLRQI